MSRDFSMETLNKTLSKFLMLLLFVCPIFVSADTIKIGLRAHHGIDKSMKQWKQTADYLSEKIPEHQFVMVPIIGLADLTSEAGKNKFDFVLTNPSSYVEMEQKFGASAVLTLRNKRQGKPYAQFGSVIFTRKDNNKINGIKDLNNKIFIAVSKRAFGGWRVAVRELLNEGFDVYKQAKQVSFSGGIQEDVVSIVGLGNADVGIVRTDMLERMAASGLIKLDDFKIINKKVSEDFPFARSTQLYPEWPFAKMRNTSSALSKKVALALLTIPSEHPAAVAGKYIGWTVPEDYQPVHNLMKDLKISVYQHYNESSVEHFVEEYLIHTIVSIIILLALTLISLYILATNRKLLNARNKQNQIMSELEERVKERTKDLLLEKENAEQASRAKTVFLSSMSHELRTPLNAILGFAQIIEHDVSHNEMDLVGDNVNEILIAGRHLLNLVNDVLDLAKIETGRYELELKNIIVSKAINDVLSLLNILANKNNIKINCEFKDNIDLAVVADLRSFRQILINIITNAIKYNLENGEVTISIDVQDDLCEVRVTDTGEGIAKENFEKIFEPFEKVSDRTGIEGSGVGLSVTKNLVEIMEGKLSVESTLGEGSTFTISFKIAH